MKKVKVFMKLKILMLLLVFNINSQACEVNPNALMDIVNDLCYECIFPITISGVTLIEGPMSDPSPSSRAPLCICTDPFPRIGIPISYFEPSRLIEVVSEPYCFPSFGFAGASNLGGMLGGNKQSGGTTSGRNFMQAHYAVFPLLSLLELVVDFLCLESSGIDYAYITEVDPLWNSDTLATIISPEALLFGNPVTNLACIADSVGSMIGKPIDLLFWCMGSWGNAYPMTGSQPAKDSYMGDVAAIASKMIYKLHRELVLWGSIGSQGMCGEYPMPIWRKTAYRLQPVIPVATPVATVIGETGLIWDSFKNPPNSFNNYSIVLFKKRDCCAL
jgi:conjugal transfer pilus assembly protein TraU